VQKSSGKEDAPIGTPPRPNRTEPKTQTRSFGSSVPFLSVGKYLSENARRSICGHRTCKDSEKAGKEKARRAKRARNLGRRQGAVGRAKRASERAQTRLRCWFGLRPAGQCCCCPAPALCERNGEPARYSTVESLSLDLGGKR